MELKLVVQKLLIPIMSVLVLVVSGCRIAGPGTELVSTEPASLPESLELLDDFEGIASSWQAGMPPDYSDSSALWVQLSTEHAVRGSQALELVFDQNEFPRAIFYLERPLDLSGGGYLEFNLYNPGTAESVALALSTGTSWEWFESPLVPLHEAANTVSFDLEAANYKSASTGWQYTALITGLEMTQRIAVLVAPRISGSVYLDTLRVSTAPSGSLPEVAVLTSSPARQPQVASTIELKVLNGSPRTYEQLEFELSTDGVYANPFDPEEVDLQVEFTSPAGKVVRVPAFWYQEYDLESRQPVGQAGWRVRFIPSLVGKWQAWALYQSKLRSEGAPLRSDPLVFEVAEGSDERGIVRLHSTNPAYLAFENGETFFPIGINMGWGSADPLPDYQRWLDGLSRNGGNLIRVWMASWSFGIEWNDTGLGDYTNRLQRAWLLDQVFRMAEERGVYIELVLVNHGAFSANVNPEWADNPYNFENGGPCENPEDFAVNEQARSYFKRRLRYIAGRWASAPALMAWEWWNEADWTPITNPQMAAWIKEMTPVLQLYDPYAHLTSTSYARGSNPEIGNLQKIAFAQLHLYSPLDPALDFPLMVTNWAADVPGKPVLFAEYGASAGGEDTRSDDLQGLHLHNALWASTFSGYASTAMYWWWDSYIDPLGLWPVFGRLDRFLSGEDLAVLDPARGVLSSRNVPYLVRMNDQRALVWLHDRAYELGALQRTRAMMILQGEMPSEDWVYLPESVTGLTLGLSGLQDGAYKAYWYSPNLGVWQRMDEVDIMNGEVILILPDFQGDLALKMLPAGEKGLDIP